MTNDKTVWYDYLLGADEKDIRRESTTLEEVERWHQSELRREAEPKTFDEALRRKSSRPSSFIGAGFLARHYPDLYDFLNR